MKYREILDQSSCEVQAAQEAPSHVSVLVPLYCAQQAGIVSVNMTGKRGASLKEEGMGFAAGTNGCLAARVGPCPLYGNFQEFGVSIEWHDFELNADTTLEWSRSFRPDSLELCLNLAGRGFIRHARNSMDFGPLTSGFYAVGRNELKAWRTPGEQHRFITLGFSAPFLRQYLFQCDGALHALVRKFVLSNVAPAALGEIHRLTPEQGRLISQLVQPHPSQRACQLWYQGKVLQLIADFFFERRGEKEIFCTRQKRLAGERVKRVVAILRRDLAAPPTLDEISREVGCSAFYLSRTFSRETGITIPQCLRRLRMEYAGELLKSGKYNVTEAAMEVGYSSLSHFSRAFCQTMGCCPALYPLGTSAQAATPCGESCSISKGTASADARCGRNAMDLYDDSRLGL